MIISDNVIINKYAPKENISVYPPYVGMGNIIIRRLCLILDRLHIPRLRKLLRNRKIFLDKDDVIVVFDSGMTKEYLEWLRDNSKGKRLIFWYWNPVRKAIQVSEIPEEYTVRSYSQTDAERENILFYRQFFFREPQPEKSNNGSVVFVGKNKGRLEQVRKIEKELKAAGVKTEFIFVEDKRKLFCRPAAGVRNKPVPYEDVQRLSSRCNVILDYSRNPDDGLSLRPMEALKYGKKLMTNNTNIVHTDFYNKDTVYVIGKDPADKMADFCMKKGDGRNSPEYAGYTFANWYKKITGKQ